MALTGCATTSPKHAVTETQAPVEPDPAASRAVQAVSLQTTGMDGQTSWLIQPDVPRIPKVAGLETQLPPHINRCLSYAFDLAQRGAVYSAAAEFQSVLEMCALELDIRDGSSIHRDALRQGLIALAEADEFSSEQVDWRRSADVRSIAASHVTPVLQKTPTAVDSIQATQAYYAYAEERLTYACGELPGSSLAFYGLGRTIVVPDTQVTHAAGKAALYHRVALSVAPKNVLAGNELGVILAQHGRLDEAEKLFQQCVATGGTPETYQNLLAVYARKADQQAAQPIAAAAQTPSAQVAAASPTGSTVHVAEATKAASVPEVVENESASTAKFLVTPSLPKIFRD
jgi:Tfp pilus assembly protein PilF